MSEEKAYKPQTPLPWTIEKLNTRRVIRGPRGELVGTIESGMSDIDADILASALSAQQRLEAVRGLMSFTEPIIQQNVADLEDACRLALDALCLQPHGRGFTAVESEQRAIAKRRLRCVLGLGGVGK